MDGRSGTAEEATARRWPWWYAFAGLIILNGVAIGLLEAADVVVSVPYGAGGIVIELCAVGTAVCLGRRRGPVGLRTFGLRPMSITPGRAVLWAALGIFAMCFVDSLYIGAVHVDRPDVWRQHLHGSSAALVALGAVVFAPVGEEIFFRGFFYRALRNRVSVLGAVAVSSALFGLMHWWLLDPISTVFPRVAAGVLFALLYERTDSLYPGICTHAYLNLTLAAWAAPVIRPFVLVAVPVLLVFAIARSINDPRRKNPRRKGTGDDRPRVSSPLHPSLRAPESLRPRI